MPPLPIPQRFPLPSSIEPDRVPPQSIEHGCDYDLTEHGFNYYYNYLDYTWVIDGRRVKARAYLDQVRVPEVCVDMTFEEFDQPRYAGVLNYLQRRYAVIKTWEEDHKIVVRWVWDAVRPNALKEQRRSRAEKRGAHQVRPRGKRRRKI